MQCNVNFIRTQLCQKALSEIEQVSKSISIDIISEEDFINSSIDWVKLDPTQTKLPLQDKKKPLLHQVEAIKAIQEYFSNPNHTRGKLIIACGTGKTIHHLKIIESLSPSIVLFLSPSISLLSHILESIALKEVSLL